MIFKETSGLSGLVLVLAFLLSGSSCLGQTFDYERKFLDAGLIDVSLVDNTIQVDLVNSDPEKNFFRQNFYHGLNKAFLRKEVAIKLSNAQTILKSKNKNLSILILDAARPRSVSKLMYDQLKGTKFENFVANPEKGSMHNFGIAVDVTIVDGKGNEIDMGFTPFRKSELEIYWQFTKIKLGLDPTPKQLKNRKMLADIMQKAGFLPLSHEWWHFNGMPKDQARKKYTIIE